MRSIHRLVTTAALTVAASSFAHAAAFKPADVSADAKWVVHLDLDASKTSKIAEAVQQRLMERDEVKNGVADIETLTGVRVPDDLNDITVYGKKFGEENNVVLIDGKFDQRRILGLVALNEKYSSTQHNDHEVVSWEDKGKVNYGAFVGTAKLVIARSLENVTDALDVLDTKADSMKSLSDFTGAKLDQTSALLYIGGTGLESLPAAAAANPMVQQARSATMLIGEKDGQAFLHGLIKAVDADKAEQLARAGEGIRSFVLLGASKREADKAAQLVGELLQTLKIDRVDTNVTLEWKAPASTVIDLIDEAVLRASRGPAGQGVRPRHTPAADDAPANGL